MKKEIPIFFSTDDNYIPYLDTAIASLIDNASKEYSYRIVVLNTGLSPENTKLIKERESEGFTIDFADISEELKDIMTRFKNVYHFSRVTYYRRFIASLFPQYDKIVYLDCDLVVLGDISELYNMEMGDNILGGAPERFVQTTAEFREYAKTAVGVDPDGYINAGVLLMNLKAFRENMIEEKFLELITKFDFDLLDPDQAYLNYLCDGKILPLKNGWNKEPIPEACEGKKNIVHYALYKKPWQYDDVMYGEYFWKYAKESPFYQTICQRKESFSDEDRAKKDEMAGEILTHAIEIVKSDETFAKRLIRK
jgi:lipopolysaccharide biosynthesis glycosyltransferase